MVKFCKECGGIMNYDPYFKANVCSACGIMERVSENRLKTINTFYSSSKTVSGIDGKVLSYRKEQYRKYIYVGK